MAIVINGSGTVTGLAVGGLPDGTVDEGTLATDSVTAAKLEASAITSADLPAGSVLQVVEATNTNTANGGFLLSTSSASFQASTLTASITPSSSSNKIYVTVNSTIYTSNNASVTLYRDTTNIGGSTYGFGRLTNPDDIWESFSITYLDSPSTTSSVTYKLGARSESGDIYVGGDSDQINTITLMEIAG